MSLGIEDLPAMVGQEIAVSDWLKMDAGHVEEFHKATYLTAEEVDLGYNRASPLGDDVVDGFLLISLLAHFHIQTKPYRLSAGAYAMNYGLDRVRFLSPVRVGSEVRCRIRLLEVRDKRPGQRVAKTENTLEVKGTNRPAMVAEWLSMLIGTSRE